MENIDALRAIEQGEKQDQHTLLRLYKDRLIDVVNVTGKQSSDLELIFVGYTAGGLLLLKEGKLLLLNDLEREITKAVVRGFLDRHGATSKQELLKRFKCPLASALQHLDQSVLRVANNTYPDETYLPRAIAFYHCGDSAALAFARKSTEIVLRTLHDLLDRELESDGNGQRQFGSEEVARASRETDSSVEPDMIFTGLYLAQEFGVFSMIRHDAQQIGIVSFSLGERVYDARGVDWDERIRQSSVSLVYAWKNANSQPVPTTAPPGQGLPDIEPFVSRVDSRSRKIFLVHGHAEEPKEAVASFLRSIALEVVILHEQANQGQTIIEKFEKHSDVCFAVVLLLPDDVGASVKQPEKTRYRARQNVILELGYFLAKLGRNNVCCLYTDGVELPSDYDGVLYIPYDQGGDWRGKLAKELSAAGIEVDSKTLSSLSDFSRFRYHQSDGGRPGDDQRAKAI